MEKRASAKFIKIITSWSFIASLIVLFVNDSYLKSAYSNWITGKLSDFSGILLVSLLLFAAFPRLRNASAPAIAVAFTLWKSPAADPLIQFVRSLGFTQFTRWVDYTDLVALVMIPLAYRLTEPHRSEIPPTHFSLRKKLSVPLLLISLLTIMGTSFPRYQHDYIIRKADPREQIEAETAAELIANVAERNGLICMVCKQPDIEAEFEGDSIKMRYRVVDKSAIKFTIIGTREGFFYSNITNRMKTLKEELKEILGKRFTNMEFAVPLPEPEF